MVSHHEELKPGVACGPNDLSELAAPVASVGVDVPGAAHFARGRRRPRGAAGERPQAMGDPGGEEDPDDG